MDADRRPISRCTIGGHRHWLIISLNGRDCMDADRRPISRCTIGGHRHWLIVSLNGRIAGMLIEGPSVGVP
jgi:hypothetical protein